MNILVELRGKKTQQQVASDLGISISALSAYELEKRNPRDAIKIRIANYYGRTVQEIFFDNKIHEVCISN